MNVIKYLALNGTIQCSVGFSVLYKGLMNNNFPT